jgi:hypothetical protein
LGVQSQQLLSQCQILHDEVCLGPEDSRQPVEQVAEARKHGSNPIRSAENDEASFKLRAVTILANDSSVDTRKFRKPISLYYHV